MSTNDVPGANPVNNDILKMGSWAEHEDGSLILVKGTENKQVIYEMYDVAHKPVVFYQDAMLEAAFKKAFSFPPVGNSKEKWTWHDKTTFPWDRVMDKFNKPIPTEANVEEKLTAAQRVAESLNLRAKNLNKEDFQPNVEQVKVKRNIFDKLAAAYNALKD